jgi:hypothetical protein
MLPTIDDRDNLVILDCFTLKFIRSPKVGEVVIAENPFKPGHTLCKRVIQT